MFRNLKIPITGDFDKMEASKKAFVELMIACFLNFREYMEIKRFQGVQTLSETAGVLYFIGKWCSEIGTDVKYQNRKYMISMYLRI